MDEELLKTFLEVYHTRHFARAAENLFVTPSAVSARIRMLESEIGTALFSRERNNIQLTRAGERFLGRARSMLKIWEQARYEAAIDTDSHSNLAIVASPGLWEGCPVDWLARLSTQRPELSLRIESLNASQMAVRLQQHSADLALTLEPVVGPELRLKTLGSFELLMVATRAGLTPREALNDRYVLADWNTSFQTQHATAFPDAPPPRILVSAGPTAFDLLTTIGTAGYLPRRTVETELRAGRLHLVAQAPVIALHVYAAYSTLASQADLVQMALRLAEEDMGGAEAE